MAFADFEHRWIDAILPSFLPAEGTLAPAPGAVDYRAAAEAMASRATPLAAVGLRLAVWLAALAPVWMLGRAQTIDEISPDRRTEIIERMLSHRAYAIRGPATLLKLNAVLALLRSPTFRAATRYDRPESQRRSLPLRVEG